jgi:hypothetical protein
MGKRNLFDGKAKKEGGRSEMKGRARWRLVGWSEKTRGIACSFWVGSAGALQIISLASSPPNLFGLDNKRPSTATRDACGKISLLSFYPLMNKDPSQPIPRPRDMLKVKDYGSTCTFQIYATQ